MKFLKSVRPNAHRVNGNNDREHVDPEYWNLYQVIADITKDVITPANILDLSRALLTIDAARRIGDEKYKEALTELLCIAIGDALNGFVAERTGTKSKLGANIDALTDKFAMFLTTSALTEKNVIPKSIGYGLIAKHTALLASVGLSRVRGYSTNTSIAGKLNMANDFATIILFVSSKALANHGDAELARQLETLGYLSVASGAALGLYALEGYVSSEVENIAF